MAASLNACEARVAKQPDDGPSIAEIAAERSLMRIFGSFKLYAASLPRNAWTKGDAGWTSIPR